MIAPAVDLTMRSDRVAYLIDLAGVHTGWAGHFLHFEEYGMALASHDRLKKVVDAIDSEIAGVRASLEQREAIGRESVEWRRDRDRSHKRVSAQSEPKTVRDKGSQVEKPAGNVAQVERPLGKAS